MRHPAKLEVTEGRALVVTWEDGESVEIPAARLRAACQCAECRSDAGIVRTGAVLSRSDDIRISGAHLVGAYAVGLEFAPDGHSTGIFSFELIDRVAAAGSD